jgi:hypothetical protein
MSASDTHPSIEMMIVNGYRGMSAAEKFQRVEELNETVLELAACRIRQEHRAIDDRELRLRIAALWLDREVLIRAFGWDPDLHPR